jgi:hypothetical protein
MATRRVPTHPPQKYLPYLHESKRLCKKCMSSQRRVLRGESDRRGGRTADVFSRDCELCNIFIRAVTSLGETVLSDDSWEFIIDTKVTLWRLESDPSENSDADESANEISSDGGPNKGEPESGSMGSKAESSRILENGLVFYRNSCKSVVEGQKIYPLPSYMMIMCIHTYTCMYEANPLK